MASIATGLDFHTTGKKKSSGKAMRSRQSDQSGGTDSGDAVQAWNSYDEALSVQDGSTWANALNDLRAGRLVHLDVWHATAGGPCLSGSGAYGHTMAVAPEKNGTKWLVADPWCSPGKWVWWEEAKLRAGAEKWGGMVYGRAVGTGGWDGMTPEQRRAVLKRIIVELMTRFNPDHPAEPGEEPEDTGGAGRILYTRTRATGGGGGSTGGDDVTIQSHSDLKTIDVANILRDTDMCKSPGGERVASAIKGRNYPYVGSALKDDGTGTGWRAIIVNTAKVYPDGQSRPTILYIKSADMTVVQGTDPEPGPEPGDCAAQVAAAIESRDEAWRDWLLAGSPGEEP
jgi:hypothetical protein